MSTNQATNCDINSPNTNIPLHSVWGKIGGDIQVNGIPLFLIA
jgi:hypothetical protein